MPQYMAKNASLKFESKTGKYALFCGKNALIPKKCNKTTPQKCLDVDFKARTLLRECLKVVGLLKKQAQGSIQRFLGA